MAKKAGTGRSGVKPPERWRCMVEGCSRYGVWENVLPGEEYIYVTSDKRSHYYQAHYLASEAAWEQRVKDARAAARAHHAQTGQVKPYQHFMGL